jgi:hypothetical protein
VNASYKCLSREPDAGNLHVRFDEGEGGYPHGCPLSTLLVHSLLLLLGVLGGSIYSGVFIASAARTARAARTASAARTCGFS